ncbi:uncharacterized protein LOC131304655 [Rhododendron vialii]|uniref:uncharacterized protein LOC131304655 n=1 Tax=Rhododendron vialii TaxID=182163 RepID=UPI00265E97B2|nr:uncharacterized protein LOC131304655 [Rhododendron vialii]
MADDNPNGERRVVIPDPLPLNSHFTPMAYTTPSCVRLPAITANNYDIKPGTLQMLPKFQAFLKKFFPIGKTLRLRQEITTFQQAENEQFYEAWERYGDLIRKCPHHDIPKWQLVQSFYSGLYPQRRVMVDASCGGSVMVKNEEDARQLFETMSKGSLQNVSFERRTKSVITSSDKPRGMYEIKPSHDLQSKVDALTEKVEQLLTKGSATSLPPPYQEACSLCASPAHYIVDYPAAPQFPLFVQEQVNAAQGYANAQGFSKPGNDPFSTTYNQGWSKHPNFSWKTEHQGNSFAQQPRPFNTQFNLAAYLSPNQQLNDTQQQVHTNTQSIARLETQVGQIANALNRREEGRLPSQPVQPLGGKFVIHDPPPADAKGVAMEDILEVFKQVKVNISLLDAIKQVPTYAKFLKDLCTQKRKYLGASVNLIPYSVYEQLGLGELKPTSVTLQLADRSIKVPRGVVKDVLVKVNDFYFPADFIVLDTEPVQILKKQTPVILGRPFLATTNANIHVRSGEMEVTFGNMTLKLNVYNTAKHHSNDEVHPPLTVNDVSKVSEVDSEVPILFDDVPLMTSPPSKNDLKLPPHLLSITPLGSCSAHSPELAWRPPLVSAACSHAKLDCNALLNDGF